MQNEKKFYFNLNHVQYIYPSQVLKNVPDLGVLNEFKDKFYTEKEVNEIVAMLIQRVPYIPNSMRIKVNVMYAGSYYHILEFKNKSIFINKLSIKNCKYRSQHYSWSKY